MINTVVNLIQSLAILSWAILMILLVRRVNRLNRRIDARPLSATVMSIEDLQPICGCRHHHCFHDENGCGHEENAYDSRNGGWMMLVCGCKRYTGPEPLPSVIP